MLHGAQSGGRDSGFGFRHSSLETARVGRLKLMLLLRHYEPAVVQTGALASVPVHLADAA